MSLFGELEKFKIEHIAIWLEQYLLFFTNNKRFWKNIYFQSNANNLKQIGFYFLLSVTLFVLFLSGVTKEDATSIIFKNIAYQLLLYSSVLSLTSFFLRKYRSSEQSIIRELLLFVIYTLLVLFPIEFLFLITFLNYEAFKVLFVYNVFSFLTYLIFYVYSSFLFFQKKRIAIIGSFLNIFFLNIVTILILNLFLKTEKAEKTFRSSILDPVSEEYFHVLEQSKNLNEIPYQRFIISDEGKDFNYLTFIKNETVIETYKKMPPWQLPFQSIETTGIVLPAQDYADTLNFYKNHNDSLRNSSVFEFSRKALEVRNEFYKKNLTLLIESVDSITNPLAVNRIRTFKDSIKAKEVIVKEYLVYEKALEILEEKNEKLATFTKRVRFAYKPAILITNFFLMPSYLFNRIPKVKSTYF